MVIVYISFLQIVAKFPNCVPYGYDYDVLNKQTISDRIPTRSHFYQILIDLTTMKRFLNLFKKIRLHRLNLNLRNLNKYIQCGDKIQNIIAKLN